MDNNIKIKQNSPVIDTSKFANPLDKCGLQVSKSLSFNISSKEDEKKDGD